MGKNIFIILITTVLFLSQSNVLSQNKQTNKSNNTTKNRIETYTHKAENFLNNNELDSAVVWIDKAMKLDTANSGSQKYYSVISKVGSQLKNRSAYVQCMAYNTKIIDNFEKHKSIKLQFTALENRGNANMHIGEFELAQNDFDSYETLLNKTDKSGFTPDEIIDLHVKIKFSRGILKALKSEPNEALNYFLEADSLLQTGGSEELKLKNMVHIAMIYMRFHQFEESIELFYKVEKAYLEGKNVNILNVYDNLVNALHLLNRLDEAEMYLDKGLVMAREKGDSLTVAYNYIFRGNIQETRNNYALSKKHFETAIEIIEHTDDKRMLNETKASFIGMLNRGKLVGEEHLTMINDVIDYYLSKDIKGITYVWGIYFKAHTLYNLGHYKEAADELMLYDSLNTILNDENHKNESLNQQAQYKTQLYKQEAELQAQIAKTNEEESKRKNAIILGISIITLLILIAFSLLYYLFLKLKESGKKINEQNKILESKDIEKTVLLKELHHRVKNNLQIVSSLLYLQSYSVTDSIAKKAFKDGQNRIDAMAMIHKYLYTNEEHTKVDIKSFLNRLVESIAYSYGFNKEKITISINVDSVPVDVDIAIPLGLISNELVSNVFKHAFTDIAKPTLRVSLKMGENLVLEISDNGSGLPNTAQLLESKTFGIELVHSLTKQLKAEIEYLYKDGSYFILTIPQSTLLKQ